MEPGNTGCRGASEPSAAASSLLLTTRNKDRALRLPQGGCLESSRGVRRGPGCPCHEAEGSQRESGGWLANHRACFRDGRGSPLNRRGLDGRQQGTEKASLVLGVGVKAKAPVLLTPFVNAHDQPEGVFGGGVVSQRQESAG